MKKLIILFLLITTPLFAQKRAVRVDSIRVNDNNVITDNGSYLLIDPYQIPVLISGGGGSYGTFYLDGNKTTGDIFRAVNDNNGAVGDSTVRINSKGILFSAANKVYIDSVGIYGMDVTDADTFRLYDNGTYFKIETDNQVSIDRIVRAEAGIIVPAGNINVTSNIYVGDSLDVSSGVFIVSPIRQQIGINLSPTDSTLTVGGGGYFTGGISVLNVTDRTDYVNEKRAIEILKDINFDLTTDEFKDQDDVFVLPYELRDRQYRSLSRCVSLLLAVAKSQQKEIELLKKQIKRTK